MNKIQYQKSCSIRTIKIGEEYVVWINNKPLICRFIQVTAKGYNFLELATSKCILNKHLYMSKKHQDIFFVSPWIKLLRLK